MKLYYFLIVCVLLILLYFYKKILNNRRLQKKQTFILNEEFTKKIKKILINNDININVINTLIAKFSNSFQDQCNLQDLQKFMCDEIECLLSPYLHSLLLIQQKFSGKTTDPFVIILLGNNGVGKTSFAVKLAQFFIKNKVEKNKIILTSLDFFRAGASQQLENLTKSIHVEYLQPKNNSKGQSYDAYNYAKKNCAEILILDTSGRIHTNSNLFDELKDIRNSLLNLNAHIYTIMVMDNNFGSISINSFEAFNETFKIDGIVLTKTDTFLGGGWLIKLLDSHKSINLLGCVDGETNDSFHEFDHKIYCQKIVNWKELNE
jgi:signal recognition particle GTPase